MMKKKKPRVNRDRHKDLRPTTLTRTPLELPPVEEKEDATTDPRHDEQINQMAPKRKLYIDRRPTRYRLIQSLINQRNEAGEIKLTLFISKHLYDKLVAKNTYQPAINGDAPVTPQERIRRLIKRWVANYPLPHPPTDPTRRNPNLIAFDEYVAMSRKHRIRKAKKAKEQQGVTPQD